MFRGIMLSRFSSCDSKSQAQIREYCHITLVIGKPLKMTFKEASVHPSVMGTWLGILDRTLSAYSCYMQQNDECICMQVPLTMEGTCTGNINLAKDYSWMQIISYNSTSSPLSIYLFLANLFPNCLNCSAPKINVLIFVYHHQFPSPVRY